MQNNYKVFMPLKTGGVTSLNYKDWLMVKEFKWYLKKDNHTNYAHRYLKHPKTNKNTTQTLHRFILNLTEFKTYGDHINGDGLDNCKINLRVVTPTQNSLNRKAIKNKESIYKGVWWSKDSKKWRVGIKYKNKEIALGYYKNEKIAAMVYNGAALMYFKEYAYLNKIKV